MTNRFRVFVPLPRVPVIMGSIALMCTVALPASAQYRAKLSRGVAAHLSSPSEGGLSVLVELPQAEVDRLAAQYDVRVLERFAMGALLEGNRSQLNRVASDAAVRSVAEDDLVTATMAITTQSTGASLLWKGAPGSGNFGGLTGLGIGIAVIDSGIARHPDIDRRVTARFDFTSDKIQDPDAYGHGTHVAGIIAGSGGGSRSEVGSAYVGMAPGAELVSLKVLGEDGSGFVSDVIQAIEFAIKNKERFKLRVINLSLGHPASISYREDPLARAVERAVAAGLVVVSSAGNLGKLEDGTPVIGGVVSPGYTPGALTVGALNTRGTVARSDDAVATYSSRGPVGDPEDPASWEIKPDLVAPGNAIVAAGAEGSYLWSNHPSRQVFGSNGGTYLTLSGASMSTAVVSGAVAQLLQGAPNLEPNDVKFALQFTAEQLKGARIIEQGAGSMNVPPAVALAQGQGMGGPSTTVTIGGETAGAREAVFANTIVWVAGPTPALSFGAPQSFGDVARPGTPLEAPDSARTSRRRRTSLR